MSDKDSKPDNVSHDSYGAVPFTGDVGGTIHKTTVEKDGETYTYGSSKAESDQNAGEKYSDGKKD